MEFHRLLTPLRDDDAPPNTPLPHSFGHYLSTTSTSSQGLWWNCNTTTSWLGQTSGVNNLHITWLHLSYSKVQKIEPTLFFGIKKCYSAEYPLKFLLLLASKWWFVWRSLGESIYICGSCDLQCAFVVGINCEILCVYPSGVCQSVHPVWKTEQTNLWKNLWFHWSSF
jgi:hypothetical protein